MALKSAADPEDVPSVSISGDLPHQEMLDDLTAVETHLNKLSHEVLAHISGFSFDTLFDVLRLAVVSRGFNSAARLLSSGFRVQTEGPPGPWVLSHRMARYFSRWPLLSVRGFNPPPRGVRFPDDGSVLYLCVRCRSPVLCYRDIICMNHHGGYGPGLIVKELYNVLVSKETQRVSFLTESFDMSEVCCSRCRMRLARKYVCSISNHNSSKVGKYLLEQNLVFAPRCCAGDSRQRKPEQFVCPRCSEHLEGRVTQAMLWITDDLQPGACRQLLTALEMEKQLVRWSGISDFPQRARSGSVTARKQRSSPPPVIPTVEEVERLCELLGWKVLRLCKKLSPDVETTTLYSFACRTAGGLAMCFPGNLNKILPRDIILAAARLPIVAPVEPPEPAVNPYMPPIHSPQPNSELLPPLRLALLSPALMGVCKTFVDARKHFKAIEPFLDHTCPVEREGLEKMVQLMGKRLRLDAEDEDTLRKTLGLPPLIPPPACFSTPWYSRIWKWG